jgi:hypothetical protein
MAIIQSGSSANLWDIDEHHSGHVVLYDASGNPIDENHPLYVNIAGSLSLGNVEITNDTGNPIPISASSLPLPTGAAADSSLTTINSKLDTLKTAIDALLTDTELRASSIAINDGSGSVTVDGSVSVSNFPATQPVSGTVGVSNFPATQNIADGGGSITVDGSVSVSNFPATQPVSGTVSVGNFPSTQAISDGGNSITVDGSVNVSGSVSVSNFPTDQSVSLVDTAGVDVNQAYDASYAIPIDVSVTTVTTGTVYYQLKNSGAKRMMIRKIEMTLGFAGTAAASVSMFGIRRASGSNTPGGTALSAIKKATSMAASGGAGAFNASGLTITGLSQEQDFCRISIQNQLTAAKSIDLDYTQSGETSRLVLASGESLLIAAQGACVAKAFMTGQITWDERT